MKRHLFILIIISVFALKLSARIYSHPIWGTILTIETIDNDLSFSIKELLEKLENELDPDCIYSKKNCVKKTLNKEISRITNQFYQETNNEFNINHSSMGIDLAGLSQGYAIDKLKARIKSSEYIINFGSDVFVNLTSPREFIISDPILDIAPIAKIKTNYGFIFPSFKSSRLKGKDIDFVVLLTKYRMLGARLDAWATSIVSGGTNTLKHLKGLKQFQGKWEYFYIDKNNVPQCSENLSCKTKVKASYVEVLYTK